MLAQCESARQQPLPTNCYYVGQQLDRLLARPLRRELHVVDLACREDQVSGPGGDLRRGQVRAVLRDEPPRYRLLAVHHRQLKSENAATARLNRVLVEHQDLLGSEGGFIYGDLTRVPLWKPGLTARLLETQAGGKPTVIFSAGTPRRTISSLSASVRQTTASAP